MKGLKKLSKMTESIIQKDRSTWIPLYYSIREDTVFASEGEGRFFITTLINKNSPKDIEETVHWGLRQ